MKALPNRLALIAILGISLFLLSIASLRESAIMDELAHIPAGYGYMRYLDFRLNPEHPPLVKAISALPLLFMDLHFPTQSKAWTSDVNGQWDMGTQFLYESGNDGDAILHAARMGPIFLTLLLAFVIYLWSARLMGRGWALLPTLLFAWSPQTLAHGHYVTTDIGAALGITLALWRFTEFMELPSRRNLLLAGLAFGIAQALKFSAVLLIPFFVLLLIIRFTAEVMNDWQTTEAIARLKRFGIRAFRYVRSLVAIFAIGYLLVIYPLYAVFTINYPIARQVSDTTQILGSFGGGVTGTSCSLMRCVADATITAARSSITRPFAEYALGVLMVVQRASGGNTSYFEGAVSAEGSRSYFPTVYALKEPLPVLILILIALIISLSRIISSGEGAPTFGRLLSYIRHHFVPFSMTSFVIFYVAYSMKSPLNIGVRHLFPIFPLIYILTARSWKHWFYGAPIEYVEGFFARMLAYAKVAGARLGKACALVLLLFWFAGETVSAAPHFLSYFNQFGGGTLYGYEKVVDSNYDWGQDLLELKAFSLAHPEIKKIAIDYFGGGSSRYELGSVAEPWWSAKGNPKAQGIEWLAVSVNNLQNSVQPTAPGFDRKPEDAYPWLLAKYPLPDAVGTLPTPTYRVGTSIFVYKL